MKKIMKNCHTSSRILINFKIHKKIKVLIMNQKYLRAYLKVIIWIMELIGKNLINLHNKVSKKNKVSNLVIETQFNKI